jgi:uncharacterized protein
MTATRRRAARSRVLVPALLAVALALVLTPRPASAQPEPPALSDTVNDFAHVINSSSRAELDRRIRALQQTTGDVIVVATVPTYQPYGDINEYAVKMFENQGRGIGDKGKDNGLLIVVAVNDHRIKIETGYDIEGLVPDGFAGETIREYITPEFRRGDYGAGLVAGVTRLINRIAEGRGVTVPDVPQAEPRRARGNGSPFPLSTIIFVVLLIIFLSRGNRRRRRRYWGGGPWSGWSGGIGPFGGGGFGGGFGGFGGGGGRGGGGFGGFGGFGGGRAGGGGASGGW